jgi:hypothetical protein
MPNYQDFAKKARARFEANKLEGGEKKKQTGGYEITRHAEYKMKQYGLSLQKVKGVIRNPSRIETGVAEKTIAVMQPVSAKKVEGKDRETWKQEIWVMYQKKGEGQTPKMANLLKKDSLRIISTWRYPGISPKRNPIPDDILLELEDELA